MSAKKLSFSALMAALSFIFLYIASILPSAKIALYAIATIFLSAVVIEHGNKSALLCYVAVSVLSLVLLPQKAFCLPFILFLGYYPILKSFLERKIKNNIACFGVKLLCGNAAFTCLWFLLKWLFVSVLGNTSFLILWLVSNVGFILYDITFSFAIAFYMKNIHGKIFNR